MSICVCFFHFEQYIGGCRQDFESLKLCSKMTKFIRNSPKNVLNYVSLITTSYKIFYKYLLQFLFYCKSVCSRNVIRFCYPNHFCNKIIAIPNRWLPILIIITTASLFCVVNGVVSTVVGTNVTVFRNISIVISLALIDVGMISMMCVCYWCMSVCVCVCVCFHFEQYVGGCR